MQPSNTFDLPWTEADSRRFIDQGEIYTPNRDEIRETILDLMPARPEEPFLAVELGVGAGWLSEAILERFPAARVLGLDASPTMLQETGSRLQRFAGRFELREFRLEDRSWLQALSQEVRCFLSCLVIHHLDGPGKQQLYRDLHGHLEPAGAVLIADLVAPRSEWARRATVKAWNAEVKRRSLALTDSLEAYRQFVDRQWNCFEYPDPVDMPSAVPEHLAWLEQAGFDGVDVFWERAGHAIYGGYKGLPEQDPL